MSTKIYGSLTYQRAGTSTIPSDFNNWDEVSPVKSAETGPIFTVAQNNERPQLNAISMLTQPPAYESAVQIASGTGGEMDVRIFGEVHLCTDGKWRADVFVVTNYDYPLDSNPIIPICSVDRNLNTIIASIPFTYDMEVEVPSSKAFLPLLNLGNNNYVIMYTMTGALCYIGCTTKSNLTGQGLVEVNDALGKDAVLQISRDVELTTINDEVTSSIAQAMNKYIRR